MKVARTAALAMVALCLLQAPQALCAKKKKKTHKKAPSPPPSPPDPASAVAMKSHQEGVMAHVQGNPKGAIAAFRRAIASKPDFAYAYFRLGFVLEEERKRREQQQQKKGTQTATATASGMADDGDGEALAMFRTALALEPSDEMSHTALGQALHERGRHAEAAAVYEHITISLNPASAQAYWHLGQVRAVGVDEWESDPDDPHDPSHCYEHAARLKPDEFRPDGTRVKRVTPKTPEAEEKEEKEAKERRQRVLQELQDGTRKMSVAGEAEASSL